jgi:DNA-binding winged helix-turn-helix (wHTH) protein
MAKTQMGHIRTFNVPALVESSLAEEGYVLNDKILSDAAVFLIQTEDDVDKLKDFADKWPDTLILAIAEPEWRSTLAEYLDSDLIPPTDDCYIEVVARLHQALARVELFEYEGQTVIVAKKYKYNPDTKEFIDENGGIVILTPTEVGLLMKLVQHDEVVDSEVLIERVWRYAEEGNPNALRVHMHRLRRKLGWRRGTQGLIETVRGIGYRLQQ